MSDRPLRAGDGFRRDADSVCLVATCHDPLGRFAQGIRSAGEALVGVFGSMAINLTSETHPSTRDALAAVALPISVAEHGAGSVGIGTARTSALGLGLRTDDPWLFYSDLDHILRWVEKSRAEVEVCLARRDHDFLVVGRSKDSTAEGPERLQLTEELVNRVYGLANGLDARWDLMIAMRLMTRETAEMIVAASREASIATDVTWPMLVRSRGGAVGYVEADGIRFLARDDFGSDRDDRDHDPREWLARMVTATAHIAAIVDFGRV